MELKQSDLINHCCQKWFFSIIYKLYENDNSLRRAGHKNERRNGI